MTGIVERYNDRRGFGFIKPLIGKPETTPYVYFHVSATKGRQGIPRGAEVRFVLVRGDKGPQAANVELVEVSTDRLRAT